MSCDKGGYTQCNDKPETWKEIRLVEADRSGTDQKDSSQEVPIRPTASEQDTLYNLSISSEIASSSYQTGLMTMPSEILFRILMHLPHDGSLAALKSTCSFFNSFMEDRRIWSRNILKIQLDVRWSLIDRVLTSSPCLTSIDFSDCIVVTDKLITAVVTKHKELRYVNIPGCVLISDMALAQLEISVTALEHLDISRCCLVTCGGVVRVLKKHSKSLRYLNVSGCLGMAYDPYRVSRMADSCLHLHHLSFAWSIRATGLNPLLDNDVVKFAIMCPNLMSLDASSGRLNDSAVEAIAKNCQKLTRLSLAHSCVKDSGLAIIASNLRRLRRLDLSDCTYVTDTGIQAIGTLLPSLQVVDLSCCFNVTDMGMAVLLSNLPRLKELKVRGCFRITDRSMKDAAMHCRHIAFIDMSSTMVSGRSVKRLSETGSVCLRLVTEDCPFVQCSRLAKEALVDSTMWPPSVVETPRQWMGS